MLKRTVKASNYLKKFLRKPLQAAIILGSGLGEFANTINNIRYIPFSDIPEFPVSTVKGHKGNLMLGEINGKDIIALQGRFHDYEGYSVYDTVFPILVMKNLGVKNLILSNASGGLNPDFNIGDIMIIKDHINLSWTNPLRERLDERNSFVDMSAPYDNDFIEKSKIIASKQNIKLQTGVYAGVKGPTYETPAEYKYLRTLGADAVGMSTVNEVITARKYNISCLAFSVISDLGVTGKIVPISHEDVIREAEKAEPRLAMIITKFISESEL